MTTTADAAGRHERQGLIAAWGLPGEGGVWVFVFCDLILFTVFFLAFLYARAQDPILFSTAKEHVNQTLGTINTILLLCSSWFVALGIQKARRLTEKLASRLFLAAAACGLGFAFIKLFEYREKILAGIVPNTNDFFNYYYILTGIHFLHVLIGISVLIAMSQYWRITAPANTRLRYLESGASFWHLVDLLWIVLFALLYLLP